MRLLGKMAGFFDWICVILVEVRCWMFVTAC